MMSSALLDLLVVRHCFRQRVLPGFWFDKTRSIYVKNLPFSRKIVKNPGAVARRWAIVLENDRLEMVTPSIHPLSCPIAISGQPVFDRYQFWEAV
jgi:hypothetical protein